MSETNLYDITYTCSKGTYNYQTFIGTIEQIYELIDEIESRGVISIDVELNNINIYSK